MLWWLVVVLLGIILVLLILYRVMVMSKCENVSQSVELLEFKFKGSLEVRRPFRWLDQSDSLGWSCPYVNSWGKILPSKPFPDYMLY